MKTLAPGLQAALESGATTLCWCWRLTRRDGVALGFTDHDRPLTFDATTFEAASGFTASEIRDAVGLAVADLEVTGGLSSDYLDEAAIAAGLFDGAAIEIWRVDWQSPASRVLMRKGTLGEIRRAGSAFTAEVRGLAEALQVPKGRLFQYGCDADLGDTRCGVDLSSAPLRGTGAIVAVLSDRVCHASGLAAFDADWFSRGLLTFTSGANAGRAMEVKAHTVSAGTVAIELWQAQAEPIAVGDEFTVTTGCDKRFETCREKFANAVRFRGFPHMPGNDFVTSYPSREGTNDGSPL